MKTFARGQRSRLDALTPSLELTVGLRIDAPGLTLDFCCFGLDADGQLSDDRFFIFYNQLQAPENAIEKITGADEEVFRVRLEKLPPTVRCLVFTASIDGAGAAGTMSQVRGGHLRLSSAGSGAEAEAEVMRYEFSGRDFGGEGALMLGEVYLKDAWRVWAVGQGFAGNLSALLKHFGGEEADDPSQSADAGAGAAPVAAAAPATPATPATPAAVVVDAASIGAQPLDSSPVAAHVAGVGLQDRIDAAAAGGVIEIGRGEFAGPIVVRRPLTLLGVGGAAGGVIWARSGPVVTIEAAGVALHDVEIQVTDPDAASDVAILARPSTCPSLRDVRARGRVLGAGEEGEGGGRWILPASLDMGEIAPRAANSFEFDVEVPVACSLSCFLAGSALEPPTLSPGAHRVRLWVREVPPESFVRAHVEVRAGQVIRTISIWGRSASLSGPATPPARDRALAG